MSSKPDFYDIEEIRLFLVEQHLEIRGANLELKPSPMHRSFLVALARKAPSVVTYQELWKDVWRDKNVLNEDAIGKIQTTKGQLAGWLRENGIISLSIKALPGEGYRLVNKVIPGWLADDSTEHPPLIGESDDENDQPINTGGITVSSNTYIVLMSLGYGSLFQIALMLEIAYQFDVYGKATLVCGLLLALMNSAAIFFSAKMLDRGLYYGKNRFWSGIGILLFAALISVAVAGTVLPLAPVTEASTQTQPALLAFAKNALIYFFPLGVIFVLIPYYVIEAKYFLRDKVLTKMPSDTPFISPLWLFILSLISIPISYLATNYMLDNLKSENDYYPLFVTLIFLRMTVCFGIIIISVFWYYTESKKVNKS